MNRLKSTLNLVLEQQRAWAKRNGIRINRDYTETLEDNLFRPLHSATRAEFVAAAGDELGRKGRRGKMLALHSSSALAVNVFDYWRDIPLNDLITALRIEGDFSELRFEQEYEHGLGTTPPNIDVVLHGHAGPALGIECKFTEPYSSKSKHEPLAKKYFPANKKRWADLGLPRTQLLAERIGHDLEFRRLAAGQLVKHILGLANTHPDDRPVRLIYLWYDPGTPEADEHRQEIERFNHGLGGDVDFAAPTYQAVFDQLTAATSADASYLDYLKDRYFSY